MKLFDGQIPVVAITGTNGKTTTTLLISHVLRDLGLCTGTTTTQVAESATPLLTAKIRLTKG